MLMIQQLREQKSLASAIQNKVGISSNINGVQISVVDDKLTFTVSGVGSTTLTLS